MRVSLYLLSLAALSAMACGNAAETVRLPLTPYLGTLPPTADGAFPALLSQTGAFTSAATLSPSPGLLAYNVNAALWSDGAEKMRWIAVPNDGPPFTTNEQIRFSADGPWTFPAGTVFVKHFELVVDERSQERRRLETRLLVRDAVGSVYGVTYKWRADRADADLVPSEGLIEALAMRGADGAIRQQLWQYPGRNECLQCHNSASGGVLGVNTRQQNGPFKAGPGMPKSDRIDNQLKLWHQLGYFHTAPSDDVFAALPRLVALTDRAAPLQERVRSFLDVNCAHCHRPGVADMYWDARWQTPLEKTGIVGGTVKFGLGIDSARLVAPRDPWRSILLLRLSTDDPKLRMPPLARQRQDPVVLDTLHEWINALPGVPALEPPKIFPATGEFDRPVEVALAYPGTEAAVVIRYTIDSTMPRADSPVYMRPIHVAESTTITASAWKEGLTTSAAITVDIAISRSKK